MSNHMWQKFLDIRNSGNFVQKFVIVGVVTGVPDLIWRSLSLWWHGGVFEPDVFVGSFLVRTFFDSVVIATVWHFWLRGKSKGTITLYAGSSCERADLLQWAIS